MSRAGDDFARFNDLLRNGGPGPGDDAGGDRRRRQLPGAAALAQVASMLLALDGGDDDDTVAGTIGGTGPGGNRPSVSGADMFGPSGADKFIKKTGVWVRAGSAIRLAEPTGKTPFGLLGYYENLVDGAALGEGYTDVEVEVTVHNPAQGELGVYVHGDIEGSEIHEMMAWLVDPATAAWTFAVYHNGTRTDLWSETTTPPDEGDVLKLRVVQDTYSVYRNGELRNSALTVGPMTGHCGMCVLGDPGIETLGFSDFTIRQLCSECESM